MTSELGADHLRRSSPGDGTTIALAGPITIAPLSEHLHGPQRDLPIGLGGVPVTVLASELLRRGHRLVVATLSDDVNEDVLITGPNLRVHVGPYRRSERARDAFAVERHAITRALLRERPDVVHAHWAYEFALGALRTNMPTLVTLHDWAPAILRFHRDTYRSMRLLMQGVTLARGKHFSSVSPYIQRAAARWGRSATVVPNGLAERWFDGRERKRRRDAPVFVSVNMGFGERKNSATLLQAFAILRGRHPNAQLQLIGGGHQAGGPAHRWAQERGVHAGVTFLGELSYAQTLACMSFADVLVHPSLEESFGMTLIEAMAKGTPVIGGARSGAVSWVLDEGSAGELTDVTSPVSLAASMDRLLIDDGRWRELSARGFEHAWETFRLSPITDRYLDLYAGL